MGRMSIGCLGLRLTILSVPFTLSTPALALDAGERLLRAYPGAIERVEGGELVFKDGSRMAISDGITGKSAEALLDRPDLDDMFAYAYPRGGAFPNPPSPEDPGRIRNEAFFAKIYGDCRKGEVEKKLVAVPWLPKHGGGTVKVTRVNGVADKLAAVSRDFEALPDDELKALLPFLKPSAGGYNCRPIAGTTRISGHGFGFAVDINASRSDYWYWTDKTGRNVRYKNQIPARIGEIFERHGFIWGAKWYHYDTMHFEYRPEMLD